MNLDTEEIQEAWTNTKRSFKRKQKHFLESAIMGDQIGGVLYGGFDQCNYIQNHIVRRQKTNVWLEEKFLEALDMVDEAEEA